MCYLFILWWHLNLTPAMGNLYSNQDLYFIIHIQGLINTSHSVLFLGVPLWTCSISCFKNFYIKKNHGVIHCSYKLLNCWESKWQASLILHFQLSCTPWSHAWSHLSLSLTDILNSISAILISSCSKCSPHASLKSSQADYKCAL